MLQTGDKVQAQERERKIPISEIYGPVVQGEGAISGHISYFLRTALCDYECSWCDSMHAVDAKLVKKHAKYMTQEEIIEEIHKLTDEQPVGQWCTITGGNPLIWDLTKVVLALSLDDMKINVETNGNFNPQWLQYVDLITCSPKPPSSGMHKKNKLEIIDEYHQKHHKKLVLKIVVFDNHDLNFALEFKLRYPKTPLYLLTGTPTAAICPEQQQIVKSVLDRYKWLTEQVIHNRLFHGAIVDLQSHALIYGHKTGV
jgi:7-carboxy-7-deazaguanine synthase